MEQVNIDKLLEEMGKSSERYINVYKKTFKNKEFNMNDFKRAFKGYLEQRASKSKDRCTRMSTTGFSFYLGGSDLEEIMKKIDEANSQSNDHDFD